MLFSSFISRSSLHVTQNVSHNFFNSFIVFHFYNLFKLRRVDVRVGRRSVGERASTRVLKERSETMYEKKKSALELLRR